MAVNVLRIRIVLHHFNFERLYLQVKLSARKTSGMKNRKRTGATCPLPVLFVSDDKIRLFLHVVLAVDKTDRP